jgi:hypothetical protein
MHSLAHAQRTGAARGRASAAFWLVVLAVLAGIGGPATAGAQQPAAAVATDTIYEVRLADGSTFFGRVVTADDERVVFETSAGVRIEVARAQIRSMNAALGRMVDGQFWREDPNQTRLLLLSPTGRTLRQGEGYFSSFWIFFPFVGYGVTDNITIAGGTPLIPEVIGRVIYLAPKVRVLSRPGSDFSVGALAGFATTDIDFGSAGILYGVGTFGSPDQSITAGAGWGYVLGGGTAEIANQPIIMLGGELRMSTRTKLLTENFVVPGESGALLTGGVRFFGERLSADFGMGSLLGLEGGIPWFPVLNFVYNFGPGR